MRWVEVQCHAFRGEQVTHRAAHGGEHPPRFETLTIGDCRRDHDFGILHLECRGKHVDAAHHATLAGDETHLSPCLQRNRSGAGDVAVGRILFKSGLHGLADDLTGQHDVPFRR